MTDLLPAWAEPFFADPPVSAPPLCFPRITPSSAYGDRSGRGVRVAIIDSGVDEGHPLVGPVADAVTIDLDPTSERGVRLTTGPHDDRYYHGTACAAIVRELAPEVEIVSVRVLGDTLKGSALCFAHGLDWCIDNGVNVANLSLSTRNEAYARTFHALVDAATFAGMCVVSAMNNLRKRTIPSEFAGVFSVACAPGTDRERIWCNVDGPADWGAAGIGVDVAWPGRGTVTMTGNSFAAPVVAGHLARILGAHPGITPWQARTVLAAVAVNA